MTKTPEKKYTKMENNFDFWSPEIGDEIEGDVIDYFKGSYGKQAMIELDNGDKIVMPNHTMLNGLLRNVVVGDRVKVVLLSETPTEKGKSPLKNYEVYSVE